MSATEVVPPENSDRPAALDCCEWTQRVIEDILAGRVPADPYELESLLAMEIQEEWQRAHPEER